MRYDYKYVQLQALLKITEVLQPVIKGNIKNNSSKLDSMESVCVHRERNEVEISLPLSSFGVLRHYYPELRAALSAMPSIQVTYPKWSYQFSKTLYGNGPFCTYVAISRDEKNRRRELVHFFFPIDIAACMVSPQFGFTNLLLRSLPNLQKYLYDKNLSANLPLRRCWKVGRQLLEIEANFMFRQQIPPVLRLSEPHPQRSRKRITLQL